MNQPLGRVLVTGGSGFIGSHLVRRLLRCEDVTSVTIWDNLSSGRDVAPKDDRDRVTWCGVDIKEIDAANIKGNHWDTIFHLASNADISKAITDPSVDFREGTLLMQNALEVARTQNVKRFFFTSGSGVYGEWRGFPFKENFCPCVPISTYGASKLACEAMLAAYCHMFDMQGIVLRMANVVGPRQTHGVGYDFLRALKHDPSKLVILGDGRQTKSYVHVDDVMEAMFIVAEKANPPYEVFNVASDDTIEVMDIAEMAISASGLNHDNVKCYLTGGSRGWKGDVPRISLDDSKLRNMGWSPRNQSLGAMRKALTSMHHEINS